MILTQDDAMHVLRYTSIDAMPPIVTTLLLPAIDDFLKTATGKDWSADNPVDPLAQLAAQVLLVRWFDDPGMVGKINDPPLIALIEQLHAKELTEEV